ARLCVKPTAHVVDEAAELPDEWFRSAETVGICGATSTPKWLMQQVADAITRRFPEKADNES
ncbi:MAG: hypothetical protein K1V68_05250, partial [Alistipes sp.]